MIKENRLEFGYGDILVEYGAMGLKFQSIRPPAEIGKRISSETFKNLEFGKCVRLNLGYFDTQEFEKLLEKTETVKIFEFERLIFDFSNFNIESVKVIIKQLHSYQTILLPLLAC